MQLKEKKSWMLTVLSLKHLYDFFNTQKSKYFSLKMSLFNGQEWCGLLVDYCDVLSAVWTLIGTHSHLHLQVHLNKLESRGKVHLFLVEK